MRSRTGLWGSALAAVPMVVIMGAAVPPPARAAAPADAGPAAAPRPEQRLTFAAEPGAWPIDGRSGRWQAPQAEIRVWEHDNVIKVDADTDGGRDHIRFEFTGPGGAPLAPGLYREVRHRGTDPQRAGVVVVSNGFGCAEDFATLRVWRVERDASSAVTAFDASLVHRCGSESAPALRAHVRYRV